MTQFQELEQERPFQEPGQPIPDQRELEPANPVQGLAIPEQQELGQPIVEELGQNRKMVEDSTLVQELGRVLPEQPQVGLPM